MTTTPSTQSHVFRCSVTGPDQDLVALSPAFAKDVVIEYIVEAAEQVILEITPRQEDRADLEGAFVSREHLRVTYPRLQSETSTIGLDILGYCLDNGEHVSPRGSLPNMGATHSPTKDDASRDVTVLGFEMLAPSFFSSWSPQCVSESGGWNAYAREKNRDNFILVVYGSEGDEQEQMDFCRYFFCSLDGPVTKKWVELEDQLDQLSSGSKAVASSSILYEFLCAFSHPLSSPSNVVANAGSRGGAEILTQILAEKIEREVVAAKDASVIALR